MHVYNFNNCIIFISRLLQTMEKHSNTSSIIQFPQLLQQSIPVGITTSGGAGLIVQNQFGQQAVVSIILSAIFFHL